MENVLLEKQGHVSIITINREKALNALSTAVLNDLEEAVNTVEADKDTYCVVITGAGNKSFVAGADIAEMKDKTVEEAAEYGAYGNKIFRQIETLHCPVIAAVNGFALGGGCELAMSCHFRIASSNAKFGQPEVNLGLIPGYGGTQRLVQLIGKGRAMELLMSAGMIDATTALQYGLVNYVVAPEELIAKAVAILSIVNEKAPLAVAACIMSANAVFNENLDGYSVEVAEFGKCFGTDDMKEGTTAFLEKRKALFVGK